MGSIGSLLEIRRTRADALPAAELHRALWDKIDYTIRVTCSGEASAQVLAMYLGMVASDGFDDGSWGATDTHLEFWFTDSAGLCSMSSRAALHWLEVVPWTDSMVLDVVRDAGWELVDAPRAPALEKVLAMRTPRLVELRRNLYHVSSRPRGARLNDDDLYSDDGLPRLTLTELTAEERVAVEAAAYAGACSCEYCRNVLPFVLLEPWTEGRIEDVGATWAALDELPAEEDAACDSVLALTGEQWRAQPLGPPALVRLRDALSRRGLALPIAQLVPMLLQRADRSGKATKAPAKATKGPAKSTKTKAKATKAKATKAKATKAKATKTKATKTKARATKAKPETKATKTKARATKAKPRIARRSRPGER